MAVWALWKGSKLYKINCSVLCLDDGGKIDQSLLCHDTEALMDLVQVIVCKTLSWPSQVQSTTIFISSRTTYRQRTRNQLRQWPFLATSVTEWQLPDSPVGVLPGARDSLNFDSRFGAIALRGLHLVYPGRIQRLCSFSVTRSPLGFSLVI